VVSGKEKKTKIKEPPVPATRTIFQKPQRTAHAVTEAAAKEPVVMKVVSWLNLLLEF
jgi:hypothetical protein